MKDDKPPIFPHWWIWYVFVTGWLILLLVGFYLFTKVYS